MGSFPAFKDDQNVNLPYGVLHDFDAAQPIWVLNKKYVYFNDEDDANETKYLEPSVYPPHLGSVRDIHIYGLALWRGNFLRVCSSTLSAISAIFRRCAAKSMNYWIAPHLKEGLLTVMIMLDGQLTNSGV